jgi:hypothetical protein
MWGQQGSGGKKRRILGIGNGEESSEEGTRTAYEAIQLFVTRMMPLPSSLINLSS